ncbi:phage holin family protein [Caenimonas terrae]|uniref:Phage holin family protein n=1 Tax=Caenimonas terrae TaxID=696074 RepID=A0ABW0ND94_9BURK
MTDFLLQWAVTAVSLWLASLLFKGIKFDSTGALVVSALLLGLANAVVKPLLIILTLPLTLVTFGLFILVINALMMLLVAWLIKGFKVSGFWTAFFAGVFVSVLSIAFGAVFSASPETTLEMPHGNSVWL